MFTGLIEAIGKVTGTTLTSGVLRLSIEPVSPYPDDWNPVIGESISIDGVCLTVVKVSNNEFTVDVSSETRNKTTLNLLRANDYVNIERALRVGDRFGGHFVSGHVDGVTTLRSIAQMGDNRLLEVNLQQKFLKQVILEGSITLDGISLTIAEIKPRSFTVSVIPYTYRQTTLSRKQPGSPLNVELDMIGKYVSRMLGAQDRISEDLLRSSGFM